MKYNVIVEKAGIMLRVFSGNHMMKSEAENVRRRYAKYAAEYGETLVIVPA